MVNLALSWQQAGLLGAGLLATAEVLRRPTPQSTARWPRCRSAAPFMREAAIIALLYALWQLAGSLAVHDTAGAYARAGWIERSEQTLGLPSEAAVQRLALPHPVLIQLANLYYATMHFAVLFVFLLWLFIRHRGSYAGVRTTLALLTLACLLVQLVPVAPPRLLAGHGFVDTATRYGQSVYSGFGVGADQLSAMPSVHVAWALLIGWAVVRVGRSSWRWLALAHPALTVLVVVLTANHFWLDGFVAGLLLVMVVLAQSGVTRLARPRRVEPDDRVAILAD